MSEPTGAVAVVSYVEDNIVGTRGIARDSAHAGQMIESQRTTDAPGDIVIRARSVAAHTDCANDGFAGAIKGEPSAEYIHAADFEADHRIG